MTTEYRELKDNAWYVGYAHGLAGHSLSEMMMSCERSVNRTIPADVWLHLFEGRESGLRERTARDAVPTERIDWTDVPY